ncbi:TetR/AcrR family transcriptional regulator [Nocardiopsis sp. NRRL B-16309]|uniref:TetR/AcrR family transcriptional regulator n=1 Tax=Nocardiopsis sp. NRRL B-16309 TaxID=1519494 RepID=UPI0006B02329|nr:TetR/AcrR family transcriptional regulator [Nocardiopsis sp. NRRL B-16309]KOX15394.1 TetR family transcriptional regulator [Nocardiopsis sp. NRRL B-16309]
MRQQEPNRMAREIDLLWGPRASPRRGPKPKLSREAVVGAAVALADAEGLEAVSMQRVAKELGYTTMSLYRHVDSKEDLLTLMGEAATGNAPPEPREDGDWRAGIEDWADATTRRYRAHPWMVFVQLSGPPSGPNGLRWMEAGLRELVGAGLRSGEALEMLLLITAALRETIRMEVEMGRAAAEAGTTLPESERDYARALRAVVTPERFPTLSRMLEEGVLDQEPASPPPEGGQPGGPAEGLDFGLQRILDGIDAYVRAKDGDARGA